MKATFEYSTPKKFSFSFKFFKTIPLSMVSQIITHFEIEIPKINYKTNLNTRPKNYTQQLKILRNL